MNKQKMVNMRSNAVAVLVVGAILLSSPATGESSKKSYHFVLVHGAFHGAWAWYQVSTILQSWGHTVTTLDMAASGIDTSCPNTISTPSQYFQPLTEFLARLPAGERVVLVGHDFGGLGVASAMEQFPEKISVGVFVAAAMPGPSLTVSAIRIQEQKQLVPLLDTQYIYENGSDKPPTSLILGPIKLAKHLYPLSPPQELTLATTLVRPFPFPLLQDDDSQYEFTLERFGSVKRAYVITEKDLMTTKDFQIWMIENNPPDFTLEVNDSDHMAMASNPDQLAHHLAYIPIQLSVAEY